MKLHFLKYYRESSYYLTKGCHNFYIRNELEKGYIYVFELIEKSSSIIMCNVESFD